MQIDLARAQQYLDWMKTKLFLDCNAKIAATNPSTKHIKNVYRGKVYYCHFGLGIGSEQEKIYRPCVVIQRYSANLSSPNTIVAPITKTSSTFDVVVPIATQYKDNGEILLEGHVLLGNIVTVSKARIGDYIANLSPTEMKEVNKALAISVELYPYYKDIKKSLNDKLQFLDKVKDQRNEAQDNLKEIYELLQVSSADDAKQKIQELIK